MNFELPKHTPRVAAALITLVLLSYLLGSIPTGFLVAKAKGVDIRSVGSGNIGATNVFRILGKGPGIIVLSVDALKGALAVILTPVVVGDPPCPCYAHELTQAQVLAGICAILGHNYTCWLKFKGGKGIATTAGVFAALAPAAFGIAPAAPVGQPGVPVAPSGSVNEDAVSALVNLGYKRVEAFGAVARATQRMGADAKIDAVIRAALQELSR